ncbi:MAG: hypothetical protein FWE62_06880 [Firmicutes bacterium]|jgi:hypothetical protein|nr:hypothetical protein [Bacillota bacterium]
MTQEELEKRVMEMILDGEGEPYNLLRKQYENSTVEKREFTGCGFFTYFGIPDEYAVPGVKGRIMSVQALFEGTQYGYMFILIVNDGRIDALEGFAFYGDWEYNYENANLVYAFDEGRKHEIEGY